MKIRIIIAAMAGSMLFYLLSSCYKNREDIQTIPRVSFRKDVVPIVTSGACGCHNNCNSTRQIRFSCKDTIFYDAISSRVNLFGTWVNGGTHPGGGDINFTSNEIAIIKAWVDQGEPYDDGAGCIVPTVVTYTKDIVPIYNTTCKGGACHGGLGPTLDYDKMVADKDQLITMMYSGGAQGHPGGQLSLSTCVCNTFIGWINQGMPK
jgi:hypothetical protein